MENKARKKNLSIDLVVNARYKTIARINNSDNEISMPWNFYFKKEMKKTKESHTFKKRNYKVYIPFIAPWSFDSISIDFKKFLIWVF